MSLLFYFLLILSIYLVLFLEIICMFCFCVIRFIVSFCYYFFKELKRIKIFFYFKLTNYYQLIKGALLYLYFRIYMLIIIIKKLHFIRDKLLELYINIMENINDSPYFSKERFLLLLLNIIMLHCFYFYFIFYISLFKKGDMDDFIIFILTLCFLMLFTVGCLWLGVYFLGLAMDLYHFIMSYVMEFFYYCFIKGSYFFKGPFIKWLMYYKSYILDFWSNCRVSDRIFFFIKGSWNRYLLLISCLYNFLIKFSVFFSKWVFGTFIFTILLIIMKSVVLLFNFFLFLFKTIKYLLYDLFYIFIIKGYFLNPIFKFLERYVFDLYCVQYIIGYFYRLCLEYDFSFKQTFNNCIKPIMFIGMSNENFNYRSIVINFFSILFLLIIQFYMFYTYIVTMGVNMWVFFSCFDNLKTNPLVCMLYTSFVILYIISTVWFILNIIFFIVILIRFIHCTILLISKFIEVFLIVKGLYLHVLEILESKVKDDLNGELRKRWESLEDYFTKDLISCGKVWDVQENRLDIEEEKREPNKFYYKKLFLNILAFISFAFAFSIMFVAYVFF